MRLQPTPESVSEARHYVRGSLAADGVSDEVAEVVELLTSEVVTNAVLHTAGSCDVDVRVEPDRVRVEVLDHSQHVPVPRFADPHAESGRGLHIVESLASRWGATAVRDNGKTVWFEVARRGAKRLDQASG